MAGWRKNQGRRDRDRVCGDKERRLEWKKKQREEWRGATSGRGRRRRWKWRRRGDDVHVPGG